MYFNDTPLTKFSTLSLHDALPIYDLIKQAKIAGDTRATIARSGLAIAIRAGARKPDMKTVDAFKRALLDAKGVAYRSEEHTSELQSHSDLVCRLLLEKKKQKTIQEGVQSSNENAEKGDSLGDVGEVSYYAIGVTVFGGSCYVPSEFTSGNDRVCRPAT